MIDLAVVKIAMIFGAISSCTFCPTLFPLLAKSLIDIGQGKITKKFVAFETSHRL